MKSIKILSRVENGKLKRNRLAVDMDYEHKMAQLAMDYFGENNI